MAGRVSSEQFVGRVDELAALDGDSGAVLIAGDAGVGKSRLVGELERRAHAAGKLVLIGECVELAEGELPYAPIVSALRPVLREDDVLAGLSDDERGELSRLWPELVPLGRTVDTSDSRQGRIFGLLLALLARLGQERPVVFVVEDLHWADPSTRDFLGFLVRATRGERVALVATFRADELHRDHPLRPFVAELTRLRGVRRLELRGFTRDELALQVEGILGEPPPAELIERLYERSEGNAFYTEELLAAGDGAELPASLRDALLLRIERLSEPARHVLAAAAIAERAVDERLLEAVSGVPYAAFGPALREALTHQVLVPHGDGDSYRFRHALVREAVYRDLLASERARLHGRLARTLAERPELAASGIGVAGELAHHWHAAGELRHAFEASVEAGDEAARALAFAEALGHWERALLLWDAVPGPEQLAGIDRAELLRRAANSAIHSDAPARAAELAQRAIVEVDPEAEPERAARLHMLVGRGSWLSANHEPGLVAYREAVRVVPPEPPSSIRAHVLAGEAQALMLAGQADASLARCEEALAIAREVGARLVEAHVLNTLSGLGWSVGDPIEHAAAARAIALELGAIEEIGRSYANGSEALDGAGRTEDAIALAEEGIAVAPRWGLELDFATYLTSSVATWLLQLGRFAEAERHLDEGTPRGPTAAGPRHESRGRLATARGDFATAEAELVRAEEITRGLGGAEWWPEPLAALGTLRLWQGRVDEAAALLRQALGAVADLQSAPWLTGFAEIYPVAARIEADRAERARDRGDAGGAAAAESAAADVVARLDAMLAALPLDRSYPRPAAFRALAAAEALRAAGRPDPAAWIAAGEALRARPDLYNAAYAEFRAAESLLAARGDAASAARLLRAAHATTVELAERPLRAEIEALARRARVALGEEEQPTDPAAELGITAREREVLAMLVDGRTNREIAETLVITEKTASVHVSHILAKLDARNRSEAAAIAHRLGLTAVGP